jgi:hypothetical protein
MFDLCLISYLVAVDYMFFLTRWQITGVISDIWKHVKLRRRGVGHVFEWYSCRDGNLRHLHTPGSDEVGGASDGGTVLYGLQGKLSIRPSMSFPQSSTIYYSLGVSQYTGISVYCNTKQNHIVSRCKSNILVYCVNTFYRRLLVFHKTLIRIP